MIWFVLAKNNSKLGCYWKLSFVFSLKWEGGKG